MSDAGAGGPRPSVRIRRLPPVVPAAVGAAAALLALSTLGLTWVRRTVEGPLGAAGAAVTEQLPGRDVAPVVAALVPGVTAVVVLGLLLRGGWRVAALLLAAAGAGVAAVAAADVAVGPVGRVGPVAPSGTVGTDGAGSVSAVVLSASTTAVPVVAALACLVVAGCALVAAALAARTARTDRTAGTDRTATTVRTAGTADASGTDGTVGTDGAAASAGDRARVPPRSDTGAAGATPPSERSAELWRELDEGRDPT